MSFKLAVKLCVVLLVAAPSVTATDFLHQAYDVGRSGLSPDPAPAWGDLAYSLDLNMQKSSREAPMVIVDGSAYISGADAQGAGIFEIDIESGAMRRFQSFPWERDIGKFDLKALESDGRTLFMVNPGREVMALPLDENGVGWSLVLGFRKTVEQTDTLSYNPDGLLDDCHMHAKMALFEGFLYVACDVQGQSSVLLWKVNAKDGTEDWDMPIVVEPEGNRTGDTVSDQAAAPRHGATTYPTGLTVFRDGFIVAVHTTPEPAEGESTDSLAESGSQSSYHAYSFDGEPLWWHTGGLSRRAAGDLSYFPPHQAPPAAANEHFVVVELDQFSLRKHGNVGTRPDIEEDFRRTEMELTDRGSGFALGPNGIYLTSRSTLYYVTNELTERAAYTLPPDLEFAVGPLTLSSDNVLLAQHGILEGDHRTIQAFDALTLQPMWNHTLPPNRFEATQRFAERPTSMAFVNGLLVVWTMDGYFQVLGTTPGSIQPILEVSNPEPSVGENVVVDMSATKPGRFGDATEFRAVWGDGSETPWQPSPKLEHGYSVAKNVTARFFARNANITQSASETFTFAVKTAAAPIVFGAGTAQNEANAAPRPTWSGTTNPWGLSSAAILATLLLAGIPLVVRSRRRGVTDTIVRLQPYNALLLQEISTGTTRDDRYKRLRPMRASLGVSDQEHAILELAAQRGVDANHAVGTIAPGELFLGRYRVLKEIGRGGFSKTHLCLDELLERKVVLKTLQPVSDREIDALLHEARALGRVQHPNVVTLIDADRVGEEVFLVMEFLEGGPLSDRLGSHRSGEPWANLAEDILAGLSAIHESGIVHRDIKPSNLLFTNAGRCKVADFGIAHIPGFDATMDAHGITAGTIRYMSPEQARGRPTTAPSDLFSAALVLFEAATGRPYFETTPKESAIELQLRIAKSEPFARDIGGNIEMAGWWKKALHPVAEKRFQTAGEMRKALRLAVRSRPTKNGRPR